ncbi:ABC transporter permease [Cytobacillus sp. IB215665]|uniref:ABC transporter permease n=1 Tax=Cytobacillus sp. IB215665 TaxID=3097357 RepID=UPI002A0F19EE|nr:ABC transporter permease subunit [Cytobacillus sp. IB215665]MDX8364384.1 ABC transporter permease subunit [Cytobacillus sp. IB215665]
MRKLTKNIGLLIMISLVCLPVSLIVVNSFSYGWRFGHVVPEHYSARGWMILFKDQKLIEALQTTITIGIGVLILNFIIAFPAAKGLAQKSFFGKSMFETLLLLPILIPSLAVAMGLHITFIKLGLADHWLGVTIVHLIPTVPYTVRILRAGYERIGVKWEEQAKSLGASPLKIFATITLPLLYPSVRTASFLIFVISLSQYVLTALIGGGTVVTLATIYYPYFNTVDDAVIASFSILFAILPIGFMLCIELVIRTVIYIAKR